MDPFIHRPGKSCLRSAQPSQEAQSLRPEDRNSDLVVHCHGLKDTHKSNTGNSTITEHTRRLTGLTPLTHKSQEKDRWPHPRGRRAGSWEAGWGRPSPFSEEGCKWVGVYRFLLLKCRRLSNKDTPLPNSPGAKLHGSQSKHGTFNKSFGPVQREASSIPAGGRKAAEQVKSTSLTSSGKQRVTQVPGQALRVAKTRSGKSSEPAGQGEPLSQPSRPPGPLETATPGPPGRRRGGPGGAA